MTIVGSGGGGGGGGGGGVVCSVSYTGLSTPAIIDENNAVQLAVGAYTGGVAGTVIVTGAVVQEKDVSQSRTLTMIKVLEKAIRHINLTSALSSISLGTIITDEGYIYGNCGGNIHYTLNVDDVIGDFTGKFNFNDFCEDEITLSGKSNVSGIADLVTEDILQLSISFDCLSMTADGDSLTIDGSITFDNLQASPVDVDMDILMRDDSTKKVYWSHNYFLSMSAGLDYIDLYMSGRYFDPDYGYVDIDTTTEFRIFDVDIWPSQGVLIAVGDTGTVGGSTKAQLTAGPPGTYEVDADTNGDGTLNWHSGPLDW